MSSRLFSRALPSSSQAVAASRASTSQRARLLVGAQVRWSSAVAAKARKEKFLPEFSMAGKVRPPPRAHPVLHAHAHASAQVAVVTGGARGLGNEFCRAFVRSGCTSLAIVDLKEEEATESAQALIKESCRAESPSPCTPRAEC